MFDEKFLKSSVVPVSLPISVRKLTSELQSTIFKSEDESHLINFVRKIDCNKDDEITQEDLTVFKESIRPQRSYKPEITNKIYLE